MALLLDTHALLWWWMCPGLLTPRVLERLSNPDQVVLVSVISLWELSEAQERGLVPELAPVLWQLPQLLRHDRFTLLKLSEHDALLAGQWRQHERASHADHIGRLLLAQAQHRNLTLVTADVHLQHCGVPWLW